MSKNDKIVLQTLIYVSIFLGAYLLLFNLGMDINDCEPGVIILSLLGAGALGRIIAELGIWIIKKLKLDVKREGKKLDLISCKDYVTTQKKVLENIIAKNDIKPCLVVFQVDSYEASNKYIAGKKRDAEELGVELKHIVLDSAKVTQEEFESAIEKEGMDENCHGIIIQLPIPNKYNVVKLQNKIPREKDVDGFRVDSCFKPCTPKGIMDWLTYNDFKFEGADVCVIGRSKLVGKPLVNMLIEAGATVTCCNSLTKSVTPYTIISDLVITATGTPKWWCKEIFPNTIVVDVGINTDHHGKLCGDVNKDYIDKWVDNVYVTPVPDGVGLLTRVALMENVVKACLMAKGEVII